MSSATLTLVLLLSVTGQVNRTASAYGTIREDELKYQQDAFKHWWGQDLQLKLADLPAEGKVPDFRIPYSGHDYPDLRGGTTYAMSKYDQAFNRRGLCTEWERRDVSNHRGGETGHWEYFGRRGRRRWVGGPPVPTWYGHCNGWTAAAIRHPEPERNVIRNGVVFTPADIKGMLAEIYMYSPTEHLGGLDDVINPATLHLTLANWVGKGSHPVGMEAALGETVINYPLYAYKATIRKITDRQWEVRNIATYALNTSREVDRIPRQGRTIYFHYALNLDSDGNIIGGQYYRDSGRIDMLWTPLKPVQGGEKGNERGNPNLNVKEVLAIWRDSVSEATRKKWLNVDPTEEDRQLPPPVETPPAVAAATNDSASAEGATVASTGTPDPTPAAPVTPATSVASPATSPAAAPTSPAAAPSTTPESATPAPAAAPPATEAAASATPPAGETSAAP